MSAESFESSTDDDENRLDHLSLQASLSRIEFRTKNETLSPEDIAAAAFSRIFDEDSRFSPNLSTLHEKSAEQRALFTEDSGSTTGRIYPKIPKVKSPGGQQYPQTPSSMGHSAPKCRHKSPSNRSHYSLHPPSAKVGVSNSIRKTKSTALPAMINRTWPRSATASTPELKVDDQVVTIAPLTSRTMGQNNRRFYVVRSMCYYNIRLIFIILNCFTLVIGFVYLGLATALCVHEELARVIIDYRVYTLSLICLFGCALFLLAIAISGLCLVRSEPKGIAAHAGCTLVMAAVLVALALLQSATQLKIEVEAEIRMLSRIHPAGDAAMNGWDYLHYAFKCCGARGYLDWCQKVDEKNPKIYTSAEDFLGSYRCNVPVSCCSNSKMRFAFLKNIGYATCVYAPTPSNTHINGCLTPILMVISYFGKVYRIANSVTGFILRNYRTYGSSCVGTLAEILLDVVGGFKNDNDWASCWNKNYEKSVFE